METINVFLISVFFGTVGLLTYAMCYVSGKCASLEEEQCNSENV